MAYLEPGNLRRGPWLEEEDERLTTFVTLLGERKWDTIAKAAGLKRSGKSCRLRWLNYLRPNLKRGRISPEEEQIILQLQQQWGNKWSRIARKLPGRTDNEIKNYWRTHLRKKLQAEQEGRCYCTMSNSKQDKLYEKANPNAWKNKNNEESIDNNNSELCSNSYDLSSHIYLNSPYEIRLHNWLSELSGDDQDQYKVHGNWNYLDSSSWMAWNSDDNDITLDSMETLWNMS